MCNDVETKLKNHIDNLLNAIENSNFNSNVLYLHSVLRDGLRHEQEISTLRTSTESIKTIANQLSRLAKPLLKFIDEDDIETIDELENLAKNNNLRTSIFAASQNIKYELQKNSNINATFHTTFSTTRYASSATSIITIANNFEVIGTGKITYKFFQPDHLFIKINDNHEYRTLGLTNKHNYKLIAQRIIEFFVDDNHKDQ